MARLFGAGAILASTVAAATSMAAVPGTAETAGMLLIGVGLVVSARIARQKTRSR